MRTTEGTILGRKLEAFAKNFVGAEARNSSNVASGPRQIRHEADFDRIEGDEKDQRNLSRGPLCYRLKGEPTVTSASTPKASKLRSRHLVC
jgi:hypothetical protein